MQQYARCLLEGTPGSTNITFSGIYVTISMLMLITLVLAEVGRLTCNLMTGSWEINNAALKIFRIPDLRWPNHDSHQSAISGGINFMIGL